MDHLICAKFFCWTPVHFPMTTLHADSIIKHYGSKQVLTDIFISCGKGEILGLLGRNGVGKSTLMKIIFGSVSSDSKFVKVGDQITKGLFGNRKLIKYLPQEDFLPNHVKVKTLINLFCNVPGASMLHSNELIAPMLPKKCGQLSGGELRLLEVLMIACSDSAFALLDEPFNGLAPLHKDVVKEFIRTLSAEKGFIISDHDYRNVFDLATRVVLIYDGGIKPVSDIGDLKYWGYTP